MELRKRASVVVFALSLPAPLGLVARECGWAEAAFTPPGMSEGVNAFAVFDDGNGPALYAGGDFHAAPGVLSAGYIARWDGAGWTPLGEGLSGDDERLSVSSPVYALEVFDDGGGPALYAGGRFTEADGVISFYIARWRDGPCFHRGDPDASGAVDISDAISIFSFLFLRGEPPACRESADTDNSGEIDLTDGVALMDFLFLGGAPPAAPGPTTSPCGSDPDPPGSPGDLGCGFYASCRSR